MTATATPHAVPHAPELSDALAAKLDALRAAFRAKRRVLTALSGGVDSSLCQAIAHEVLGRDGAIAVTAKSETLSASEFDGITALAAARGWDHRTIEYSELAIPQYAANPVNRCFFCKHELYGRLTALAAEWDCDAVVEGTNADDVGDHRPGMKAAAEKGTFAPLLLCGANKSDVRALAEWYKLPNHAKPSGACLSSRFPYGQTITREGLDRVGAAEDYLRGLGFTQVRVRHHEGRLARVELLPAELAALGATPDRLTDVHDRLKSLGFAYVTLDLKGYRTGSLNEGLTSAGVPSPASPSSMYKTGMPTGTP